MTQGSQWIRFRPLGAKRASGLAEVTESTLCALCPSAVMVRMANVRFTPKSGHC